MELIGVLAGILTLTTYIPQAYKTIKTRKTRDLSLPTLLLLFASAVLWVVYGMYKDLPAVWITNAVVASLGAAILIIKLQNQKIT